VHRTPREAKAVYRCDRMRKFKFNSSLSHPFKASEEANRKWVVSYNRWSIVTNHIFRKVVAILSLKD